MCCHVILVYVVHNSDMRDSHEYIQKQVRDSQSNVYKMLDLVAKGLLVSAHHKLRKTFVYS